MKTKKTSSRTASYDLHNHTYWSFDGSVPPEAYLWAAQNLGISCIAITEHHHHLSSDDISRAKIEYPDLTVIRAAELTASTSLGPIDLLCYGIPDKPGPLLTELFEKGIQNSIKSGQLISNSFLKGGISYDDKKRREALLTYKPGHVIDALGTTNVRDNYQMYYFMHRGWVNSEKDYRLLTSKVLKNVERPPFAAASEIRNAVRESGGLIVLAHPAKYLDGLDLKNLERLREECDLDGIECAHYLIPLDLSFKYREYCKTNNLVSTAGSDSHSYMDIERRFGRHGGEETWFEEFFERLLEVSPGSIY